MLTKEFARLSHKQNDITTVVVHWYIHSDTLLGLLTSRLVIPITSSIFGFHKWESVRSFIDGLGRLDFLPRDAMHPRY